MIYFWVPTQVSLPSGIPTLPFKPTWGQVLEWNAWPLAMGGPSWVSQQLFLWLGSKWVEVSCFQRSCYISFSLSSFYRLSWRSDSAPNITSFLADYSSTCYTSRIYTYFQFQVFFLMSPTFTCAPVHPSTCFHFSFHMLWLCSRPFLSYYDILYFYVLSSLCSRFILTQYINQCILVVVLQFVNWHWFSSSPILSLSFLYPLKALSTFSSLSSSSGNYIITKTNLQPSNLTSRLTSWPLTKF